VYLNCAWESTGYICILYTCIYIYIQVLNFGLYLCILRVKPKLKSNLNERLIYVSFNAEKWSLSIDVFSFVTVSFRFQLSNFKSVSVYFEVKTQIEAKFEYTLDLCVIQHRQIIAFHSCIQFCHSIISLQVIEFQILAVLSWIGTKTKSYGL